jgi:uncharacterized protein YbaR (Trm112 family)/SAM-dependent methyltransferase
MMGSFWMWRLKTLRRRTFLGFRRGDVVLDVGSGHRPHPRADVLCDRYLMNDAERAGPLVRDRPLVAGDLTALPFRDKAVDFVICQHVLEHVDDPGAALEELMRVATRGYIETPSPLWEKLVGRSYHRWMIGVEGGRLMCRAKPETVPYRDLLPTFEGFSRSGEGWPLLTLEHFDEFYTAFSWKNRIDYEIAWPADGGPRRSGGGAACAREDAEIETGGAIRWSGASKRFARGLLRLALAQQRAVDLDALIACPNCHGSLARGGSWLACGRCRIRYPVRAGVPILLDSESVPLEGWHPYLLRGVAAAEGIVL